MNSWVEWVGLILTGITIVYLVGWAVHDFIVDDTEPTHAHHYEFSSVSSHGFTVGDRITTIKVHGRPRLYDWEAEGDL